MEVELQGFDLQTGLVGLQEVVVACLSPAIGAVVEWAACPENIDPGFGGRYPLIAPQGHLAQTAPTSDGMTA